MRKIYYISSFEYIFSFGKHEGEFFCDVLKDDPTYFLWCAANIPEFGIHPNVIRKIRQFDNSYIFPETLLEKIGQEYDFGTSSEKWNNYYKEYLEKDTFERYNGSYAQDEMGYSDDEIDTIFEGDPLAYWNID